MDRQEGRRAWLRRAGLWPAAARQAEATKAYGIPSSATQPLRVGRVPSTHAHSSASGPRPDPRPHDGSALTGDALGYLAYDLSVMPWSYLTRKMLMAPMDWLHKQIDRMDQWRKLDLRA